MLIRVSEGFPEDEKAWQDSVRALKADRQVDGPQALSKSQPAKKMQYSYSSASRRSSHHDLRRPNKVVEPDADAGKGKPNEKLHPVEPLSPSSTISLDRSSNGRPVIYRTQTSSDVGDATSPLFSRGHSPGNRKPSSARSNSPGGPMARILPPRLSLPWINASMPGGPTHHRIPAHYPPQQNMYQHDKGPVPYQPPPHQFNAPYLGSNPNQSSPPSFRGNMSTSSQSAGPSTIESGPPTPVHTLGHGYSPALSKRSSFDRSAQISAAHSRDGSFERSVPKIEEPVTPAKYAQFVPPERNGVDVGRIEAGLDTRTTVMLKVCRHRFNQCQL
jgi:hypothetical protein